MSPGSRTMLAEDWPEASQFKKSIRLEFALYVSGIMIAMMLVMGYIISSRYVKTVTQSVVDKLLVQARSYSEPAGKLIIAGDAPDALLLNNICKKLADGDPDIYWAGITDDRDTFIAHTDIKQVINSAKMRPVRSGQFQKMLKPKEGFSLGRDTVFIAVPIAENNVALGNLSVAASAAPVRKARTTSIVTVATITLIMAGIGIPVTIAVLRRRLRPISIITDHLKTVDLQNISLDIPVTSKNEFGFLAETIRVMGSKLGAAQKELIEKERMTRELEIAREIQANILPKAYPTGVEFQLAGTYRSAKEVGGDYYDFVEFDDDRLGILIADVSGKSLPGMLVMLITRDIVKRLARSVREPAELLTAVNADLLGNIKQGMFVTMFYGVLDKKTGEFKFASAGHNQLIVIKGDTGKSELIKTRGFPLGMMDSDTYKKRIESGKIMLSTNDWLIQYTDGVNEAQNIDGEEFGLDRLMQIIQERRDKSPGDLVSEMLREHDLFVGDAAQYDDITLLAIKWVEQTADTRIGVLGETEHVGDN
ncbi:MAG: SpoIIE family protein phosphatase [Candidatus Eisenbacteria bacterium]